MWTIYEQDLKDLMHSEIPEARVGPKTGMILIRDYYIIWISSQNRP